MKTTHSQPDCRAFTLVEALLMIAILALLAGFILPCLQKAKQRSGPHNCVINLKEIGMAFQMWSDDNGAYPMKYKTDTFDGPGYAAQQRMYVYFQMMSNELSTPKILVCPGDAKRTPGTNFTTDFNNSKISYFVGLDAVETNATMFLAGDRNISNGTPSRNGILNLTTNQPVSWTKNMHDGYGNIAFPDGSVQSTDSLSLGVALQKTRWATNRLALP